MWNSLAIHIGWRFFKAKQSNRFIGFISIASMLGIALGVAVLITVLSAMNGFEKELVTRFLNVITHAEVRAITGSLKNWQGVVEKAESIEGVIGAAPEVTLQALIRDPSAFFGIEVHGIEPSYEKKVSDLPKMMKPEAWASLHQKQPNIVLGVGVAEKLDINIGDFIVLYLPRYDSNLSVSPRIEKFKVTGFLEFGGQLDHLRAYISRTQANRFLNVEDGATSVKLKVDDIFMAPYIVRQLGKKLSQYVYMSDWTRQDIYTDIQLVRMIMYLVLFLVIAVACFNIVSTLVMSVKDKQGEIAILATMGLSSRSILQAFMVQGAINGVLGTIIGSILGVLVSYNLTSIANTIERVLDMKLLSSDIYFIDYLPSDLQSSQVFLVMIVSLTMSFLATIYPAYKASQIAPARALSRVV